MAYLLLNARSHQIKIATDWLQTGFQLAFDWKNDVNGTIQNQCYPIAFFESEASQKPLLQLKFGVNEP